MFVFDEDFNEEITYGEFIDTCDAYGAPLPSKMPEGYVSVEKRALMKLIKKMNRKSLKPDHIFKMKDSESVSAQEFMIFVNKTLRLGLLKREQHALVNLCDTNQNNTIAKEEFIELVKKGEKYMQNNPGVPLKNNYFNSTGDAEGGTKTKAMKAALDRSDTSVAYAGDAKTQMLRVISASPHLSIEHYFEQE